MLTVLKEGQPIRARDERKPDHFWADKEIVEDFQLGVHAFATYMLLCYYARSTTGRAWPSIKTLAERLKVSRQRIRTSLKELEAAGLVIITPRSHTSEKGNEVQDSYIYTLTAVKKHREESEGVVNSDTHPGQFQYPGVVNSDTPNKTNKNNTESTRSNALSSPSAQTPAQPENNWYAINHKTMQIIVPGQTYAQLSVDMSMLSDDWHSVAMAQGEYKGYARLSLNAVLESPSKVPQKVSLPPEPPKADVPPWYGPPIGTRWIYPLEGIHCHLVRDANQPPVTLCGITPLPSHAGGPASAGQVQCAKCLEAAQKKPAKPKHVRDPRPEDVLFDSIALHLFSAHDKASQHAVAGRVGQIMYGDKRSGRCHGLIAFEKERKGIESLDFGALAKDVERFWKWFQMDHAGLDLKDCAKVMEWWVKWRAAPMQSSQSDLVDDPDRPGIKITQQQLRTQLEEKKVMAQLYGKPNR